MGLFGGSSKGVIDVIEWVDYRPEAIVQRFPESGPGDFKFGSQLIVRESQTAVFYRDGKALDTFGPGRHTLSTANLPILEGLVKVAAGGHNVFTCEVFFINQKVFTDQRWGTPNPIDMKDPDLGWVQLRAHGSYSYRISEPQLFISELVGQQQLYTTASLNQYLKGSLRNHLNSLLGTAFESYAKIRASLTDLAEAMKVKTRNDFGKYGIELRDFFIEDVSVPEEVQEAFRMRARLGAMGDQMGAYMQYQTGQAIVKMAEQPGSGGQAMQMGAGLGMGMVFPQMMAGQMGYPPPGYPPPGYPPPQGYGYPPPPGYPGYPPQGGYPPPGYPPQGQAPPPGYPPQGYPPQQAPAPAAVACPKCNAPVAAGGRFCANCGSPVPPPGMAAPVPPPAQ